MYLFHELPADARRAAAKEMARVLKPGGILSFTDSVQYGDRTCFDKTLGNFTNFNEPYYMSYISEDIGAPFTHLETSLVTVRSKYLDTDVDCYATGAIFEEAGLQPDYKLVSSSSKTLSFKKPLS